MVVSAVGIGRRILGVAGRAFNVDDALCLNDRKRLADPLLPLLTEACD